MYPLSSLSQYEALEINKWGIREFTPDQIEHFVREQDELDVIIVPGLAFDGSGRRIGHGRGYYDRFIEQVERRANDRGREPPLTGVLDRIS